MAEDLLNHCFLRYKANNFHYLAAAGAFERHDLKDASHQKCPHYRGFTIRFTVRPAILLFLFEVERGVGACCVASRLFEMNIQPMSIQPMSIQPWVFTSSTMED